jgi:hypothetical protein
VATIQFTLEHVGVEILNVDGLSAIYGTLNGVNPTTGGANTFCVPASVGAVQIRFPKPFPVPSDPTVTVKIISAGTPTYHVTGIDA